METKNFNYQKGIKITKEQFLNISIEQISHVYEGKRDCCRCGCGGEYTATRFMKNPRSIVDTSHVETLLQHTKDLLSADFNNDILLGDSFIDIEVGRDKSITFYFDELN